MARAEGKTDERKSTEETSVREEAELRRIDSLNLEAGRVSMDTTKVILYASQFIIFKYICTHLFTILTDGMENYYWFGISKPGNCVW